MSDGNNRNNSDSGSDNGTNGVNTNGATDNNSDGGNTNANGVGDTSTIGANGDSHDGREPDGNVNGQSDGVDGTSDESRDDNQRTVESASDDESANVGTDSDSGLTARQRAARERERRKREQRGSDGSDSGHSRTDSNRDSTRRSTSRSKLDKQSATWANLGEPKQISFEQVQQASSEKASTAKTKSTAKGKGTKTLLSLDETRELLVWLFWGIASLGAGRHWELNSDEADLLSEKAHAVLQQFPESVANKYGKTFEKFAPCVSLIFASVAIVVPRIQQTKIEAQYAQFNQKQTTGQHNFDGRSEAANGIESAGRSGTDEAGRNQSTVIHGTETETTRAATAASAGGGSQVSKFFGNFG